MVPSNILGRVFLVQRGENCGTAFAVEHDGRQFLVTARHVLDPDRDEVSFEIFRDGTWKALQLSVRYYSSSDVDVIALLLKHDLAPASK
jgi:hypothetical protein